MKTCLKKLIAMGALAMIATGFGATTAQLAAQTRDSQQTTHAHRMVVDGDIGDGTSPTKKG